MSSIKHLFFTCFLLTPMIYTQNTDNYQKCINEHAYRWITQHINQPLKQEESETLVDLILLSYQVIESSCNMILAKQTIQEELLKIKTPSPLESWQQNFQIELNDTTKLEQSLETIKKSQLSLHDMCTKFKQLASHLIHINPEPTQQLITDLKTNLIFWGAHQPDIREQFVQLQDNLKDAVLQVDNIDPLIQSVQNSKEVELHCLKDAVIFFSLTYKKTEAALATMTTMRTESIKKLQIFFKDFFKAYYTLIYEQINIENIKNLHISSTHNSKIPEPNSFFTVAR